MKVRVSKRVLIYSVGIAALFFTLFFSLILLTNTRSKAKDVDITYRSIRIEEGDTLYSLANTYLNSSGMSNHNDFAKEISRLNRLSSDCLFAGAYIVIPVIPN